MKWIKKGQIFNSNNNYPWMQTHASLPIVDHLENDLFRIYFSTRDLQNRSSIGFVEINIHEPKKILKISKNPVFSIGKLGTFDDSGVMASCLVKNADKKFLYYLGWNKRVTIPYHNSIGLAISEDNGETFTRISDGPIIERTVNEPYFNASSFVMYENNLWRMWYLSCIGWIKNENFIHPKYHIKYAESKDGINWERNGMISVDFKDKDEWAISRPCVLKENGKYLMWYSYRGKQSYQIGYAESDDGISWTRKDDEAGLNISSSGWDSEMIEYPFVFKYLENKYMFYNGNNFGKTGFGYAILDN